MHATRFVGMAALALCGTAFLGCGDLGSPSVDLETADRQSPLLGIPGGFYDTPPSWAFCGYEGGDSCHGGYVFNSRGASPGFLRRGTGMYRVMFENQASNGNAQVASASGDVHCNVAAQFPQDSGVGIDVFCRAPSGALTDAHFMLSYYRDTNVGGPLGGYAYVSGVAPFATSNTWNSSGGPITVQGLAPGNYRVSFTGQLAGGDNAQVSALTSGGAYCTLGPSGGTAAPSTYVASAQRACPPTSAFRCSTATTSAASHAMPCRRALRARWSWSAPGAASIPAAAETPARRAPTAPSSSSPPIYTARSITPSPPRWQRCRS